MSGTIPDSAIAEIKSKVRPSDIIGQYVNLKRVGREFVGLSPFQTEKTPSFTVNDDKQMFHCFSSGIGGDVIDFLVKHQGLSWIDAVARLAAEAGVNIAPDAPKAKPTVVCHYVYEDAEGEPYLRVTRKSDKSFSQSHWDLDGWRPGKPQGPAVPYRLPEILAKPGQTIHLVEGEKSADYLRSLGLLATTAPGGGPNFPLSDEFAVWFDGQKVRAYPDNDAAGKKWAERVAQRLPDAEIIWLPDQAPKAGADDWLAKGRTVDDLINAVSHNSDLAGVIESTPGPVIIAPTPFEWCDPASIPPREWVYDTHLIRKFVSLTVSPGGLGKSSLALVEALSMVVNRPLLDDAVIHEPDLRVWYWNGEDPQEETRRRVMAACKHYGISSGDLGGRLFTDSGRDMPLMLGHIDREGIQLDDTLFQKIEQTMIENRIDVFMADPFVSAHRLGENDNNAIDALVKRLGKLADVTNAAVEIVHHVRKPNSTQAETDVNDARGASALLGAVRSARVLNVMSEQIAQAASIPKDLRQRHFSVSDGKSNMSAKASEGRWRFLESVCLDNFTPDRKSDNVGVVTYFEMPEAVRVMQDLSDAEAAAIRVLKADDTVKHWEGRGKKPTNWLGHRILDDLGIHEGDHDTQLQKLINAWLSDGIIVTRSGYEKNNRITYLTIPNPVQITPESNDSTPF